MFSGTSMSGPDHRENFHPSGLNSLKLPNLSSLPAVLKPSFFMAKGRELPLALVDITLRDDTLGAHEDVVVEGGDGRGGHWRDGNCDGLTFGGDQDNVLADFDARLVSEDTGNQKLGTIPDGVERGVLHCKARVLGREDLERPLDDISSIIILNNYSS